LTPPEEINAMKKHIAFAEEVPCLGEQWFDPLETGVRQQIRGFIEGILEEEVAAALSRERYRRSGGAAGYRHGHRHRQLLGTFGAVTVAMPRARLVAADGQQREWRSKALPAYKRRTDAADHATESSLLQARRQCPIH
jgi:putative transposase